MMQRAPHRTLKVHCNENRSGKQKQARVTTGSRHQRRTASCPIRHSTRHSKLARSYGHERVRYDFHFLCGPYFNSTCNRCLLPMSRLCLPFLLAVSLLIVSLQPTSSVAQAPDSTISFALDASSRDGFVPPDSSIGVSSIVIRSNGSTANTLPWPQPVGLFKRVDLPSTTRARFPVLNYTLKVLVENACVQRVPNTETNQCHQSVINGTPVTRYPGINEGRFLRPADAFERHPYARHP